MCQIVSGVFKNSYVSVLIVIPHLYCSTIGQVIQEANFNVFRAFNPFTEGRFFRQFSKDL